MATKTELLKEELVTKYAYQKDDFIGENGKPLTWKQLEALLKKEEKAHDAIENQEADSETDSSELDEFDVEVVEEKTHKFKDDDLITVMAGINGQLVHESPVGNGSYKFSGFGQRQTMPYKELKAMNQLSSNTLEDGWIIILNKDLIKEFGLEEQYKKFLTPRKVDEILQMPAVKIKEVIQNLPKSMKTTLIDVARARYNSGKLDSSSVIRTFEEMYDISFEDNLPLKDIKVNKN